MEQAVEMRVVAAAPTPSTIAGIVRSFAADGREGIVSAYDDAFQGELLATLDEHPMLQGKPFPKLARDFAVAAGVDALRIAKSSEVVAAVRASCRDLASDDPFAGVARFPAFHRILANALSELDEYGFDADRLEGALLLDPALRAKARSMARIGRSVGERLRVKGLTTLSRLVRPMLAEIPEPEASAERLLVFAGASFSPVKLDLLRWASRHGIEVTLVVDHSEAESVYGGARRTLAALGVEPIRLHSVNRLVERLFRPDAPEHGPLLEGGVTIESAGDGLAECEWALRAIAAKPELETIIVARRMETYAPLLEAASRRLGVPLRIRRSEPLLSNGLARAFLCTMEALTAPRPDDLVEAFECRYVTLSPRAKAAIREMALRAEDEDPWRHVRNPAEPDDEGYAWLEEVFAIRARADEPATAAEWATLLDGFAAAERWALPDSDLDHPNGSRDGRALGVMRRVLRERAEDSGEAPIPFAEFVAEVRAGFEGAELWVPAVSDATPVVSDPASCVGAERVIALGVLEGVFPRRQREDPILDDDERAMLSSACPDLPALPDSATMAAEERDAFARLCALASDELRLSYPRTEGDRDNVRAFYLQAVQDAHPARLIDRARSELVPDPWERVCSADRELGERLDALPDLAFDETLDDEAREAAKDVAERATLRELTMLPDCPFQFVMRHKFGLRSRTGGGYSNLLPKLAKEARLLEQPNQESARAALRGALEALIARSRLDRFEREAARVRGDSYIEALVRREFAARARWGPREEVDYDPATEKSALGLNVGADLQPEARSMDGDVPVLHYSRLSDPNGFGGNDVDKMLMWLVEGECRTPLIVEIDSARDVRARWLFGDIRDHSRGASNTISTRVSGKLEERDDDGRIRWKVMGKHLREVLTLVRAGEISTRPGPHCARCEYADLCRNPAATEEGA